VAPADPTARHPSPILARLWAAHRSAAAHMAPPAAVGLHDTDTSTAAAPWPNGRPLPRLCCHFAPPRHAGHVGSGSGGSGGPAADHRASSQ